MNDLDWLVGYRFQELLRSEFNWTLEFDGNVWVVVQCLWRLIEDGRIQCTGEDDGHQFGLPSPLDAAIAVNQKLAGAAVTSVVLIAGTLDLEIRFSSDYVIQLIPNSSGYEAWQAFDPPRSSSLRVAGIWRSLISRRLAGAKRQRLPF